MGKLDNIVGNKFGRLLVLKKVGTKLICLCDCGKQKEISGYSILSGNTKSCGCLNIEIARRPDYNLVDFVFGNLTVLKLSETRRKDGQRWLCVCSCGKEKEVSTTDLRTYHITSCGCKSKEVFRIKRKYPCDLDGPWYKRFTRFIYGAKKNKHECKLSPEEFKVLSETACFYCGSFSKGGINGIDRINSRLGYTIKNVVSCCKICNFAKSNLPIKQFMSWVKRIYEFNFEKRKL